MDTRQNRLAYLRRLSSVKRGRTLTILWRVLLAPHLLARKQRTSIPYPRGSRGGYLVPFTVLDGRRGYEHEVTVVIEMFAPTSARPHYLPVDIEISLLQMSALTRWARTTCYRRCRSFKSIRYRGNRIYFDRDTFYEEDWPLLDNVRARDESRSDWTTAPRRNARPGRHRRDCVNPASHKGRCSRRRTDGPRHGRWMATPNCARPPHRRPAPVPDDPTGGAPPETRWTVVECRLFRLAGGNPELFSSLRDEYSDEVAADRAAGRFADAPTLQSR
jgi:hypothetical protein